MSFVFSKEEEEDGVVPNKLYVGGIPYQSTEDEIRSYFRSCGVITKVDCKMRPADGAFTGIAFITFQVSFCCYYNICVSLRMSCFRYIFLLSRTLICFGKNISLRV